jgi:hypothetical protein
MDAFDRLWNLADRLASTNRQAPNHVFDAIGLNLLRPFAKDWYIGNTPKNADVFAYTAGDGVHFSILELSGRKREESPVVMTSPMAPFHQLNIVLGRDVIDFLRLGCQVGYGALENLAYEPEEFAILMSNQHDFDAWYYGKHIDSKDENERLLASLRNEFDLKPWNDDVVGRLTILQAEFTPHMIIESE